MGSEAVAQRRRSIRLPDYDYGQPGAYFVTVCVANKACRLGRIADAQVELSTLGQIVDACWLAIPEHFPWISVDAHVVMPNHVHGILIASASERRGKACLAPTSEARRVFGKPPARALSSVVGAFKSAATRRVNRLGFAPSTPVWQRNYYEHVIRNDADLQAVRKYIADNPAQWSFDEENPARRPT